MDLAKTLIRSVVRAFYETKHTLVIDALLPNEDLAILLGMQQKDLRKLCGKLKEDRLLAVHSRPETREGFQRPINKDYYYIDFHATIDAIKYRIFNLTEMVKAMYKPSEEKKDYFCPQCRAKWTQFEVLDKVGPMGFECHRCGGLLEREELSADNATGHGKQSRLMSQLEGLLKMLQQVDSEDIPSNDFDTAYALAIPIKRNLEINPTRPTAPLNAANGLPAAVKGMAQADLTPLDVSVTTSSERTAAEQAAEAQRKADIAAQNVLPVWHTTSTVTGQQTLQGRKEEQLNSAKISKDEEEEERKKKGTNALNEELTAYYAQMLEEKEKEAREDREADESSGDEDDDFEDVGPLPSAAETPSSSMSAPASGAPGPQLDNSGKGKGSESDSSAPVTNTPTPIGSGLMAEEESGPASKKVKFERSNGIEEVDDPGLDRFADKDSDEDEEAEFEDAL